jgi:hypothetical protein
MAQPQASDEKAFRDWYSFYSQKLDLDPDPDNQEHFYDWRAAFRAGAKPDKSAHWPSEFKREGHPNLVIDGIDTRTGKPAAKRPDLRGLLADPQFNALPIERRQAILTRINPQFAAEYVASKSGQAAAPAKPASPWQERSAAGILQNAGQSILGAVKAGAESLYESNPITLGRKLGDKLLGNAPPEGEAAMTAALQPANEAQAVGRGIERMGEYAVPGGPARGVVGAGFQGARGAATTLLQGGTPKEALVSAGVSATGPLMAKLGEVAGPWLKDSAQRQMARVLGPTTRENKAITEKVVPELLQRGVTAATRKSFLNKASAKLAKTGFDLDKALQAVPKGTTVNTAPIVKHLDDARAEFIVNGVEIDPAAIRRLDTLKDTITQLGPDVDYQSLRRVRQIYDKIVADARGFFGKTVAEGSNIDAQRELAGAIRRELAKATPDVAKINKEYSFWSNVEKVLGDTVERTQSQSKPLGEQLVRAGAITGGVGSIGLAGGPEAASAAIAIAALNKAIRSTAWNTWSAVNKARVADLVAAGRFDEAASMLARVGGATVAQVPRG